VRTSFARLGQLAAISFAASLIVGCSGSGFATPIIVVITPSPTPVITSTTPSPATATATATAAATASPAPTKAPSTAAPASACLGSAANIAFFADAAKALKFSVYCAAGLPADWTLNAATYLEPSGGALGIRYHNNARSALMEVYEGNFCPYLPGYCGTLGTDLGPASFGDLPGELYLFGSSAFTYVIWNNRGSTPAYAVFGSGMTKDQLVAWAANFLRVSKS
jgi:hypothetical protein